MRSVAASEETRAFPMSRARGLLANELRHLKDALNNIIQGLVVFDADETMVVCNDRYFEMYGLSKDDIQPGCSLDTLLEHRMRAGFLVGDFDEYHREITTMVKSGKTSSQYN